MTLQELQQQNKERKKLIESRRKGGKYFKLPNDQDMAIVKLVAPFEGYDVQKKSQFTGKMQWKVHYRLHVLGDWSNADEIPLSSPQIQLSIDDVRVLKEEDAKIWTTPDSAVQFFQDETSKGHSIFLVKRLGKPKDTKTIYTVQYAPKLDNDEIEAILPKFTAEDLAKLQSEEKFRIMPEEEIDTLVKEASGAENEGQ